MNDFNTSIIDEFHANAGVVGGPFDGAPMILITTTGAKSGQRRTTPLVYLPFEGKVYIFGSKAGAPTNPDWYHNLTANPAVTVEIGTEKYEATAVEVTGAERDRLYAEQVSRMPGFKTYEESTTRVIPVVELQRNA
ncbi:MAG TPA: nitroreductase family deazaflavin-dependent oxidoreductase [Ilumatobacteraceae bacterium]|jgi:deazaflavin-dependent oxidoreductase (nitroreductase family)